MGETLSDKIQNTLAEIFDRPLVALRQQLAERLSQDLTAAQQEAAARAAEQAARSARCAAIEGLHIAVRRLRQAPTITEIGATLLETAGAYCGRIALLVHKGDSLTGWRASGFDRDGSGNNASSTAFSESWARFQMPVSSAPALAQAIESREAVVSLSLPDHLSQPLIELLGLQPEEKVYLFPLCLRQAVVAVVYVDSRGAPGEVEPAAVEMLCSVAEAAIEALSSRPTPAREAQEPEPGRLELPLSRPTPRPPPTDWSEMSPPDRDMHLRAQRFARVLVADLQLYRAQEIREGRKSGDLYGRLKDEIDKSREVYDRKFGQSVAAGIDYLHLELLRTLAEDQEALLGPDYPGPMAGTTAG